jgi:hypothetical protein
VKSLTSIKAICYNLNEWEDINWYKLKNADLLMNILDELRTRPTKCAFQWVKAHADNENNNKADELANEGRISEEIFEIPKIGPEESRAIHDRARLSKLTMKITYGKMIVLRIIRSKKIRHPEYIEDAKNLIEKETGLRPTTEAMIRGIWKLEVHGRLEDHLWNMLLGKIKCGNYWKNMPPDLALSQYCTACHAEGERERLEDEHHLWLDYEFNGQKEAWITAKTIWRLTTKAKWPDISIGLIRGIGGFAMEDESERIKRDRDAERARILIATTVWSIWKSRNQRAIQNIWIPGSEPSKPLRKILDD